MAGPLHVNPIVLLVEDDDALRRVLTRLIEAVGLDVMEAANADEAIERLEHNAGIRIVFTDVDMPGAMNGLRLANAVRGRWPPMKIVIGSGGRRPRDHEIPLRGVFLSKPYDGDTLVETLKAIAA